MHKLSFCCCIFRFQKAKKLNVFKNDDETWDYTGALNNNSGLCGFTVLSVSCNMQYL